jgi:hypothetical protein
MEEGRKVRVTFDTNRWPVHHGTYVYEGRDEVGYWLRRADGVQRHFEYADVAEIQVVDDSTELETENY